MTDALAAKIAALLAKAEGTDNEHERDAFSAAAEKLMLKWGVDEAMAAAAAAKKDGGKTVVMKTAFITFGAEYYIAWMQLASHLQFGIGNVQVVRHGNLRISVLGTEGDVARYVQLFESIKAQASRSMNAWWKTAPSREYSDRQSAWKNKRQFLVSFSSAVGQRLRMERDEILLETTGSELVLVDQKAAVERYVAEQYGRLGVSRSRGGQGGGHEARMAGRAAGQRADLGSRKSVGK